MPCKSQQVDGSSSLQEPEAADSMLVGPGSFKAVHKDFPSQQGKGDLSELKLGKQGHGMQEGCAVPPCSQQLKGQPLSKPCSTDDCSPGNNSSRQPTERKLCKSKAIYITPHTQEFSEMLPLWLFGHSLSRRTCECWTAAQVHPLGVVAEGLPGSAAIQGPATSGFKHPVPSLAPRASGAHCGTISSTQLNLPQCLEAQILPYCRALLTSHSLNTGHLLLSLMPECMPTNLAMIFLSQEIGLVLQEALSQPHNSFRSKEYVISMENHTDNTHSVPKKQRTRQKGITGSRNHYSL